MRSDLFISFRILLAFLESFRYCVASLFADHHNASAGFWRPAAFIHLWVFLWCEICAGYDTSIDMDNFEDTCLASLSRFGATLP